MCLAEAMAAWIQERVGVEERPDNAVRFYVVSGGMGWHNVDVGIVTEPDQRIIPHRCGGVGQPIWQMAILGVYTSLTYARSAARTEARKRGQNAYLETGFIRLASKPEYSTDVHAWPVNI